MSQTLVQILEQTTSLSLVGGKALALGNLLRSGFNVPDGFVVTTAAFGRMDSALKQEILKSFDKLDAKFVAVRSSAVGEDGKTTSWAGQLDTFLNINRKNLIKTVEECWQSAQSKRAESYARQHNVKADKTAVIIQPMLQSDVAGVAFSMHPVTKNPDQIVVEAGLGLGEAVVSGEITPDTYIIEKSRSKLLEKHLSRQIKKLVQGASGTSEWQAVEENIGSVQKLADDKIKSLVKTVRQLEQFYKFPVDMEWLLMNGQVYIMQCRPITTL